MSSPPGGEEIDRLNVENEIAMRRLERMVEFLRAVYENEVHILKDHVETTEQPEREKVDRPTGE